MLLQDVVSFYIGFWPAKINIYNLYIYNKDSYLSLLLFHYYSQLPLGLLILSFWKSLNKYPDMFSLSNNQTALIVKQFILAAGKQHSG